MKVLKGSVAAVTGAGSGIGRGLAINLAREGCSLALADIDQDGLDQTKEMIDQSDIQVTTQIVDVADRDQVYQFADNVAATHGKVKMIINNAGVGVANTLEDLSYEDFECLLCTSRGNRNQYRAPRCG